MSSCIAHFGSRHVQQPKLACLRRFSIKQDAR
jgi:hypothetical protein